MNLLCIAYVNKYSKLNYIKLYFSFTFFTIIFKDDSVFKIKHCFDNNIKRNCWFSSFHMAHHTNNLNKNVIARKQLCIHIFTEPLNMTILKKDYTIQVTIIPNECLYKYRIKSDNSDTIVCDCHGTTM